MKHALDILIQIADGLARQFGQDCEVVIHDLKQKNIEHSIIHMVNGHVTGRQLGDGPAKVVLETLQKQADAIEDRLAYLARTPEGKVLKSSTMFIRDDNQSIHYILSINYDITRLLAVDQALKTLTETEMPLANRQPETIVPNVSALLDSLIEQSVALAGKPVALMTKDEKVAAIQFLKDSGAFLITRSGDKIANYFGISKFTLYNYIDQIRQTGTPNPPVPG